MSAKTEELLERLAEAEREFEDTMTDSLEQVGAGVRWAVQGLATGDIDRAINGARNAANAEDGSRNSAGLFRAIADDLRAIRDGAEAEK